MDLFSQAKTNILPHSGEVIYYGPIINEEKATHFFNALLTNIRWENDIAKMFGKTIVTKRKVAWYGDKAFDYTYSNNTKKALPWTQELHELREIAESTSNETFNSCLLNLYHDGSEGMAWHSDGEKDLKENGAIGSMSFGAIRKFAFKHKETKETVPIILDHGSLLVMKGSTQKNWLHRLPPTKKIKTARINLTFRTIDGQNVNSHKNV